MSESFDLLIKNTTIVDGSGKPAFPGDVAIRGERIVAVGPTTGSAVREIDGTGLVTCPGFVDSHSHADLSLLQYPLAENLIMQGVTTFLGGNCGLTAVPYKDPQVVRELMARFGTPVPDIDWTTFDEWLSRVQGERFSLNYVPLAGHKSIREAAMGRDHKRAARPAELEAMKQHVREAMESGAFGLSSGFDPGVGEYATPEETVELARVAREFDGIYTPHTRFHQDSWVPDDPKVHGYGLMHTFKGEIIAGRYHGLLEAVEVAKEAEIRLLIAHFTPAYMIPQPQPRFLQEAAARASLMEIVDKPRQEGVDVYFNVIASTPSIGRPQFIMDVFFRPDLALPSWLAELSRGEFVERLRQNAFREQLKTFFFSGRFKIWMVHPVVNPYWMDCFQVLRCKNQDAVGKTIGDLARKRSPKRVFNAVYHASVEVVFDLLIEDPEVTWGFVHDIRENPGALPVFLRHPAGMPCSDTFSLPAASAEHDLSQVPPIAYNLFPHYLRTFVKEQGVLSMEEAVMKATYLPAQVVLGLSDRGLLTEGAFADIVIFDQGKIGETNDFLEPARPPAGIEHVIVNGEVVYEKLQHTGRRPGKVLRKVI